MYCLSASILIPCLFTGRQRQVVLRGVSSQTARQLVDYMYGSSVTCTKLSEAIALFKASNMYGLMGLHQQCIRVLKDMLTPSNVVRLQQLADGLSCTKLQLVRVSYCASGNSCKVSIHLSTASFVFKSVQLAGCLVPSSFSMALQPIM